MQGVSGLSNKGDCGVTMELVLRNTLKDLKQTTSGVDSFEFNVQEVENNKPQQKCKLTSTPSKQTT